MIYVFYSRHEELAIQPSHGEKGMNLELLLDFFILHPS